MEVFQFCVVFIPSQEGRDVSEQSFLCTKCRSEMKRVCQRPPLQEFTPPLKVIVPLPKSK